MYNLHCFQRELKDHFLVGQIDIRVRKQKILVAALAGYIHDLDTVMNPPEEPEQPEHLHFEVRVNGQHFNPNLVFDLQERKLNNQCLVFTQKGGKIAVKPVELMPHQFAGDYSYSPASCKNKEQIESKKETL